MVETIEKLRNPRGERYTRHLRIPEPFWAELARLGQARGVPPAAFARRVIGEYLEREGRQEVAEVATA